LRRATGLRERRAGSRLGLRATLLCAATAFSVSAYGGQATPASGSPRTLTAVRLTEPLNFDGKLDEAVYLTAPSTSDFIQLEPIADAPATERTELWVLYDEDNVYFVFRCWESHPERLVANDMRRDNPISFTSNDSVGVSLDTFNDRRNAAILTVNPIGGLNDGQVTNSRQYNGDWNPIWSAKSARFDGGWTVEMAVPFKSLRYAPGRSQVWGFNASRNNRGKNEWSFFSPLPASRTGQQGLMQVSFAGRLLGLEAPPASKNIEVKPYAISDVTSDRASTPALSNDVHGAAGIDVKYGVTQALTADFTYNTDFAQVEADEQQVNLTRFSLFFPEKREFFLENQGTFAFGGGVTSGPMAGGSDVPILFYSRSIGQDAGRIVPLRAGGRLSGRLGRFSVGLLDIQTDGDLVSEAPGTNFSVVRVKRDILRRSSLGAVLTRRSRARGGIGSNTAYGVDAGLAFFDNLAINAFWARTNTTGVSGEDTSYRAQLDYAADRYGLQLEHLSVGDHFNPEVGFIRRDDMRKSYGQVRFSPRPANSAVVRKLSWIGTGTYIENGSGQLETRTFDGEFALDFQNTDRLSVSVASEYEFVPRPFAIARGVTLPVGGYDFSTMRAGWTFGQQRPVFGNLSFEHGTFYNGHKTAVRFSRGRVEVTPQLSIEPSLSWNRVELKQGQFTTTVVGSRVTFMMTPLLFTSALIQYSSSSRSVSSNVRLRWEYYPGSELFVVYNEQRNTRGAGFPGLANRVFIVKINRLFRF
jgi:hypothetical protein